ncbi:membrane fusion protein (multidrug efflux system) [Pedobacter sp. CG_S7]|uniref:efflux RND transporter periplasmic adaptor subunit n=1 Tax=Pedobacter sp. CG_S7 TaxID=3143930 RepID=UPI003394A7FF
MNYNFIKSGFFILGTLVLASCGNSNPTQQQTAPPPTSVSTYTVGEEEVIVVDTYPGVVVPLNEVELRAEVGGYITAIYIKDGQKVTKGQKLYEIDRTKYIAAHRAALANVQVAKANLAKAKKDADRYIKLNQQEAIAKQRVDYALTDLANAASQVAAAEAALATVASDLRRSMILSPLNGTIGISQVKLGAFVSPGTTLLNTVSTTNPIAVDIAINQKDIARFVKLQQNPATLKDSVFSIEMQDNTTYQMPGQIVTIDRAVDPDAGTIKVRISYPNAKNSLRAGMTCNVKVLNRIEGKQLTIPYKAVAEQLGAYSVYVVGDSSKAEQRIVKLGSVVGDKVVITDGVKIGDIIVSEGGQNVRPGAVVKSTPKN